MAETIRIAELATLVSEELFKWFKWSWSSENDLNFECCAPNEHFTKNGNTSESSNHTHPTDVVFYYHDPYLNKKIYFNTDLKSYGKSSIKKTAVQEWLTSLIAGTVCARSSHEWRQRYQISGQYDIRGFLLVYNHDGEYKKSFYDLFSFSDKQPLPNAAFKRKPPQIHIKDLKIPKGVKIHMVDPLLIDYMLSIKHDCTALFGQDRVPPPNKQYFYYPQQKLHRQSIANKDCPATIELISGPFLIIGYEAFTTSDGLNKSAGFVVYYREEGSSVDEFVFLLDTLSSFQLINEKYHIEIRHASDSPHSNSVQNFNNAQRKYCEDWGLNVDMSNLINNIVFGKVTLIQKIFCDKRIDRESATS